MTDPEPEPSLQETQEREAHPEDPPEADTKPAAPITKLVVKMQSVEEDKEPLTMRIWVFPGHERYYTTHQVTTYSYIYTTSSNYDFFLLIPKS